MSMGFLKRAVNEEETDGSNDLEEQYLKLFPKIGRDFISREDFEAIIVQLFQFVNPLALQAVDLKSDGLARLRAKVYKDRLDTGNLTNTFRDLIDLDD